jgi:hypothetical protein
MEAGRQVKRIEKTFRCRKDGRAIARIEVAEQKRWLVRVAGRDGHARSLESTMAGAAEEWRADRKLIARQQGPEWYFNVLSRIMKPQTQAAEQRQELPSELDKGLHALGKEPMPYHAVCPKCHTPYALTVSIR